MQEANTMPVAVMQNNAGNWTDTLSSGLSTALDSWMKVEQIRQVKSSSGQDQLTKQFTPELDNGAAIAVDPISQANATTANKVPANSFTVNKNVLMVSAGVLVVAILLKTRGFK